MITAERYHDISCGHRVAGHENKCAHLHGHNYRVHFVCKATSIVKQLDPVGRVLDFSVMKSRLCMWLEEQWDHRFLVWDRDEVMQRITGNNLGFCDEGIRMLDASMVWTPFNPTAENMAYYLLHVIGPQQLHGTGVQLTEVRVEETRKCSATATIR